MSPANSLPFRFQPAWLKSLGVALLATLLASGACARPKPFDVGHLNSIAARSSALISSATGSFDSASPGNLSAAGPFNSVPNIVDAFSLQINSQTFTSALCPASKPACRGWQQFIYSRYQCLGGCVLIEYWLLDYGSSQGINCPAGWLPANNSCYINSASSAPLPLTAADLTKLTLTATAGAGAGAQDTVTLTLSSGSTPVSITASATNVLRLDQHWTDVEWNIVGDCCSNKVDLQGTGTVTLVPRIKLVDGTQVAPSCVVPITTTAETNSLNFGPTAPTASGAGPAMVFMQSNGGGTLPNCAASHSFGDTHLQTFHGLLYDFQATGDFVLAQIDSDFVVQARQIKVADRWPDASVNHGVATRVGKHRVAVCLSDAARLVVDGKATALRDGDILRLPDHANVRRRGNVYFVQGPTGHSVKAEVNDGWINVTVGLGHWPAKVVGLLASAIDKSDRDSRQIVARDGTVLTQPLQFDQLYGRYADSWRVAQEETLLKDCGDKDPGRGVPSRPFEVEALETPLRERARAVCTGAGIQQAVHLDACTLDVAATGKDGAALVYTTLPAPAAVAVIQASAFGGATGPLLRWLLWAVLLALLVWAPVRFLRKPAP
jgi:hypothetical protein